MYPHLGKFLVPDGVDGLLRVTYQPEPRPVAVRGSVNPWVDAQATQLRNQEDAAWKTMQTQTAAAQQTWAALQRETNYFNMTLAALEKHLDQKLGDQIHIALPSLPGLPSMGPITSKAQLAMSIVFPPFLLPGLDMVGKLIGGFFGIGKKAKPVMAYVEMLMSQLQASQATIQGFVRTYGKQLNALQQTVNQAVAVKGQLAQVAQTARAQSVAAAQTRDQTARQAGLDLIARNAQAARLYPRHPGGSDDL